MDDDDKIDPDENEDYEAVEDGPTGPLYEEETQYVTERCGGLKQPSGMCYDADPSDWQIWSVLVDEDEAASGFSSAVTVQWFDSNGVTFCCDTHGNRITSIQGDGRAYTFVGGECGHRDGPQDEAKVAGPSGVAVLASGAVIIADTNNHCIRHVFQGWVSTIAGAPRAPGDKDGVALYSAMRSPCGVCCDPIDGCVYVADTGNSKIKRITPEGAVTTFAGGVVGFRDGLGPEAQFEAPYALCYWRGRLLVADTGNHAIREIDLRSGAVRTVAGDTGLPGYSNELEDLQFAFPNGLTVRESDTGDEEAILWVADSRNACIRQLLIDDEPYEDPIEKSKDDNDADGRPQSQPSMHSAGTESHHLSASHRPLTSPAFLETGGPSPVAVPPFTVGEPRSGVPMKTKVIACESLIGGAEPPDPDRDPEEGDHPDPMRRGNINGSFEDATLEQPMGLAFNSMDQQLLCSDFANNNVRQVAFPNGSPTAPEPFVSDDDDDEDDDAEGGNNNEGLGSDDDDDSDESDEGDAEEEAEEDDSDASSLSSGTAGDDAL